MEKCLLTFAVLVVAGSNPCRRLRSPGLHEERWYEKRL